MGQEEILERVERRATEYEKYYHGCAQSTFLALGEEFNLPGYPAVFKAAGFLGGGTARMGNMCGTLAASMLALGLAAGRERIEDSCYGEEIDEITGQPKRIEFARKLFQRFVQE